MYNCKYNILSNLITVYSFYLSVIVLMGYLLLSNSNNWNFFSEINRLNKVSQ